MMRHRTLRQRPARIGLASLLALLSLSFRSDPGAAQTPPPGYRAHTLGPGVALGINSRGHVVGATQPINPHRWEIFFDFIVSTSYTGQAFVWRGGAPVLLPSYGKPAYAVAINDSGEVAGVYVDLSPTGSDIQAHAVKWDRQGVLVELGTLPILRQRPSAWATGINNLGQVCGYSEWDGDGYHAVLFDAGGVQDLNPSAEELTHSRAWAINDAGRIAGDMIDDTYQPEPPPPILPYGKPALFRPYQVLTDRVEPGSAAFDLDDAGGAAGRIVTTFEPWNVISFATALFPGGGPLTGPGPDNEGRSMNNDGDVVGRATGFGFLYRSGTLYNLNTLVGTPPAIIDDAWAINACGSIAGGMSGLAVLLTPVDSTDTDGDALPDKWERCGIDGDADGAVDFELPDADPDHKDIYVEIDVLSTITALAAALNDVTQAFALVPNAELSPPNPDGQAGINLHLERDDRTLPSGWWSGDGWGSFDLIKGSFFGRADQRSDPNASAILAARRQAYHYAVFADRRSLDQSSGTAETPGNDLVVFAGALPGGNSEYEQAGTFMHELGHNLGLLHGGADSVNYKPNYYSVMNYSWQFPMPGYGPWKLDYSHAAFDLNEAGLIEADGLPALSGFPAGLRVPYHGSGSVASGGAEVAVAGGPVDWYKDGTIDQQPLHADINWLFGEPPSINEQLLGHLDWPGLFYNFRETSHFENGVHGSAPRELTRAIADSLRLIGGGTSGVAPAPPQPTLTASPNPFDRRVELAFAAGAFGNFRVEVFDIVGRRVRRFENGPLVVGHGQISWDGRDDRGRSLPAGIYIARLYAEGAVSTIRLVKAR